MSDDAIFIASGTEQIYLFSRLGVRLTESLSPLSNQPFSPALSHNPPYLPSTPLQPPPSRHRSPTTLSYTPFSLLSSLQHNVKSAAFAMLVLTYLSYLPYDINSEKIDRMPRLVNAGCAWENSYLFRMILYSFLEREVWLALIR